ncbi:MAG: hypothetical protein ACTS6G_00290 [Candidatus Hodgkinia cicadicola]
MVATSFELTFNLRSATNYVLTAASEVNNSKVNACAIVSEMVAAEGRNC